MDLLRSTISLHPIETLVLLTTTGLIVFFIKTPKVAHQRKQQRHPNSNNCLIDLIRSRSWDDVLLRINTHPSDARARTWSGNRSTPLHLAALYRAPSVVIRALLDANPAAAQAIDADGCTALHVALLYGADEESCLILVREGGTVAAGLVSVHMGSALHMCCRHGSSVTVMRELLRAEPALAKLASHGGGGGAGLTPPLVLWHTFTKQWDKKDLIAKTDILERDALVENGEFGVLLEKMGLLLQAVAFYEGKNDGAAAGGRRDFPGRHPSYQIVHLAVQYNDSLRLPLDLLRVLILIYPEQLLQRNHRGSLPLHLAAERSRQKQLSAEGAGNENQSDSVIYELIKACPDAAGVHDANQRLPLSLAIESGYGWNDGIESVLYAAPDALITRDAKTHVYPFMLASFRRERSDVSTIFRLLRACPEAIRIQK